MFVVHIAGERITGTYPRVTLDEALAKAERLMTDGSVSISDPRGIRYLPEEFDRLREAWIRPEAPLSEQAQLDSC